eukprot:1074714-Pleurochrysis_carterae.AAC.2
MLEGAEDDQDVKYARYSRSRPFAHQFAQPHHSCIPSPSALAHFLISSLPAPATSARATAFHHERATQHQQIKSICIAWGATSDATSAASAQRAVAWKPAPGGLNRRRAGLAGHLSRLLNLKCRKAGKSPVELQPRRLNRAERDVWSVELE